MAFRNDTLTMPPSRIGPALRGAGQALGRAARRHRHIHALALFTLALAAAVGLRTGNHPDFGALTTYGFYLLVALWGGVCAFALVKLVLLAVVDRDPSPSRALIGAFAHYFTDRDRLANGVNGLAAFIVFASGFSVLKGAIAILSPFSWDVALHKADVALHFGYAPHEWLAPLTHLPVAVFAFNFAYNLWFVALVATVFTVAITNRDSALRHRFLLSFMLVWLVGGFFMAMGFSSAGPCFFERAGLGTAYTPLMSLLHAADADYSVWALSTQDLLWEGYSGKGAGSIGISAFPSMHVASAVLFALYAARRSVLAGVVMWVFAATIMVGSVVLAWHYAVDGYAGALLALAVWKIVGRTDWLIGPAGRATA